MNNFEKEKIDQLLKERYLWQIRSPKMYQKTYQEVVAILDLPYWKDARFSKLLTKHIWSRSYFEIVCILDMHYDDRPDVFVWDDLHMQKLLSSAMWRNTFENVREKVNLPIWQNRVYQSLLSRDVWSVSIERLYGIISIMEELGLTHYLRPVMLKTNAMNIKVLYRYMVQHEVNLFVGGNLNPMLYANSPTVLLKNYGVNLKQLLDEERKREMKRELSK